MITLRSRKYGNDGMVMLSVRVKDSGSDNAYALGIKVDEHRWISVNQVIQQVRELHRRGAVIFIEDPLASKLWQLLSTLEVLHRKNSINAKTVAEAVNTIFNKVETEIAEKVIRADKVNQDSKPSFSTFFQQYIDECESGERLKEKSTRKITPGTLKSYKGCLSQFNTYQREHKCVIDWDDLTLDFYDDFKKFFIAKSYSPNTIAKHIKTMKTVLYAARDMHYTTRDDFTSSRWSADREEVDNVYITKERIREMESFDMSDYQEMKSRVEIYEQDKKKQKELIHALKRDLYRRKLSEARDVFVMGCLTGQRISDYKRINSSMIETIVGDRKFLHIKQQKTGKDVYPPYTDTMRRILERYEGKLPKVYDQHLNERIKVVGLLLGWTEPAGITERRGVMSYTSGKRFCDAIMTHTARRSFATNAYKDGVSLSSIMAITGHSSEEMLKRYLKLTGKERAMLAADEFDKLKLAE